MVREKPHWIAATASSSPSVMISGWPFSASSRSTSSFQGIGLSPSWLKRFSPLSVRIFRRHTRPSRKQGTISQSVPARLMLANPRRSANSMSMPRASRPCKIAALIVIEVPFLETAVVTAREDRLGLHRHAKTWFALVFSLFRAFRAADLARPERPASEPDAVSDGLVDRRRHWTFDLAASWDGESFGSARRLALAFAAAVR